MWQTFKRGLDRFLDVLTAISMGVLVVDVTWQVVTRFILKNPSNWTEELATCLMIWVGLLGSAVALNRGAHLGIDYFVGKLPQKKRLFTEIFVYTCISAFSVSVLLIGGTRLVLITFMQGGILPALGILLGYVYLAVPIAGFFLSLYSIEFLIETIIKIKNLSKHAI
jgi:TRAP-type C4-dicarboxylate transport system permease small subunit